jgi:hypothetical protein
MDVRKSLGAVVIGFVTLSPSFADDTDSVDTLRAAMIPHFVSDVEGEIGELLPEKGMAESDVQRTIKQLAEAITDCTIDALIQLAEEQSIDAEVLLAETTASILDNGGQDFGKGLDEERLTEELNYCFLIAFEGVGVEAPQITR